MINPTDSLPELERRVLHGLALEWETARWILPSKHQKEMRPPLFSLRDMKDRWGFWSGEKREIALSRTLVLHHSWDTVREVLLHEMAHQMAEEVLGAFGDYPHGPIFCEACTLLRANPRASGNFALLDERLAQRDPCPDHRILRKIQKLLALARSQNRYEAEAAMGRAHHLMAKYNIGLLAQDGKRHFITAFVGKPALRHLQEDYALAHLLQDFYFVRGIWVPTSVPAKGKMGRVFEISGVLSNVQMAHYVHDFVQRFIEQQWREYNVNKGLNHLRRSDFAVGIIDGFRSKLKERPMAEPGKSRALMKSDDPQLTDYMADRYPRTLKVLRGGTRRDPQVVRDGRHIGKNMVITKGISSAAGNRGLFIEKR